MPITRHPRLLTAAVLSIGALIATLLFAAPASAAYPPSGPIDTNGIQQLARDNVGKGACDYNTRGGKGFDSSCTGNGGSPEYWCADFTKWVWAHYNITSKELTPAARSFYDAAKAHGMFTTTPAVGDVAIFSNNGSTSDIHHVAIVIAARNGNIETISGDWGGTGSSESAFAGSSHVTNNGVYGGAPGYKGPMKMYLIGYARP